MHASRLATLVSVASAALLTLVVPAGAAEYNPVTDARLVNPEPHNWLMYRGTYDSHGYSPLSQINTETVADLKPLWSFSTGMREGHQAPPVVNDGVMFITTPNNNLIALDAESGEQIWKYVRDLPEDQVQMHPTNRGVGLYGNLVYMATVDCYVVALDAETGEVVWETEIEDYAAGYYMTLAPLVADGKVMVGVSGGEWGIRGFVAGLDAESGEELWRTFTIPGPGEPGHDTWQGDTWKTGGVPVWLTGSYDPETNLSYWGTGNGGPWIGDARPGDNLYATSLLAIDVETGEMTGYHQYHWNDSWDWDEVSAPLLIDFMRGERTVPGLVHPGRNGYLWFLEREGDDIGFVDAKPYVKQDVFTSLDPDTGRPTYDDAKKPGIGKGVTFCPSLWGGKDWPPAAWSPRTRLLYIPANDNVCSYMEGIEVEYRKGREFMGSNPEVATLVVAEGAETIGELQAWNVDTAEMAWSVKFENHNWGPVLATAGDVVFMGGTGDRYFRAFDARTGDVLWSQRTNSGITGVPSTYMVGGKQYVADQVAELNAILDEELPEFPEDWRERAKSAPQGLYNFYRFGAAGGSHGTHPGFLQYGKPFCDLMDHPLTMEMMRAQLGDCFRLDRIFGMRMREGMPSGRLHSDYGPSHPFTGAEPGRFYPQPAHQARHGFAVAAFNLTDSGPETGGLCCIPGSHNTHIRLPQAIRDGRVDDVVHVPKAPAGSVTFFTEATTHGTLAWTGNHERRSLLYKYCASQLVWSRARVTPPEDIELTTRQQRLLEEPAGAHWFFKSLFEEEA